jgi:hypothetical protein
MEDRSLGTEEFDFSGIRLGKVYFIAEGEIFENARRKGGGGGSGSMALVPYSLLCTAGLVKERG